MQAFWQLARRLFRRKGLIALAAVAATISALGLGAGLLALATILDNILGEDAKNLPTLAADLDTRLQKVGLSLPAGLPESLPTGRFDAVLWVVIGLAVLTIVGATANFVHAFLAQTLVERTIAAIRRDAFRRVVRMPLGRLLHEGSSDLVARIVNDAQRLSSGFLSLLDKGPAQVTKGAVAFIAAIVIDWRSLAAVPVALVMGVIIRKLGKRVRRASRGAMEAQADLLARTNEALQGLRVVKAYTAERTETARFARANREYLRQMLRARTARALASPLLETIGIFVLGAWSLFFAKQIIDGTIDAETFLSSLIALAVAASSLKPLSSIIQEVQASSPAADRLSSLIAMPAEPGFRRAPRREQVVLPRHSASIEFDDVWLTYAGAGEPALRGVSLRIEHGETVAFVGGNGSGKTTLLSLVPRLLEPDGGRVLLDGRDIRSARVRDLRRQIGVVTQETVLFRGTIASNISYGRPGATREQVEQAARRAHADDFIERKPGGYDAAVGEQGVTLSGGQRQRVALARAFLRDPAILILDEATSMIDADSERQIAAAVREFAEGRTVLIVAHRLSTVVNADRIVVMQNGEIADVGRHDELLARCEAYRVLASSQLLAAPAGA